MGSVWVAKPRQAGLRQTTGVRKAAGSGSRHVQPLSQSSYGKDCWSLRLTLLFTKQQDVLLCKMSPRTMSVFSYLQTGTTRQLQMVSTVFHELTSLTFSGLPLRLCLFRTSAAFFMLSSILNSTTAHPLDFPSASNFFFNQIFMWLPSRIKRYVCNEGSVSFSWIGIWLKAIASLLMFFSFLFSFWAGCFPSPFGPGGPLPLGMPGAALSSSILGSVAATLAAASTHTAIFCVSGL